MNKLPFVSICLLTYKRAKNLGRSLDSLLAQTHPDFELIINDDCSPDETEAVARSYEKRDPRVRYCRRKRNLRYAGNQNAAIDRARSDYVAIVHDGDVYREDLIEKWVTALIKYPTAALVFNDVALLNNSGETTVIVHHPYPPLVSGQRLFDEMILRWDSPIFGIVMVRKSCVKSVGPFDTQFPVLADVDMWLRLLLKFDGAFIDEVLYNIAARENDHISRDVNWSIVAENERIHRLNAKRRYPDDNCEHEQLSKRLDKLFFRLRLQNLYFCLKPKRWGKIPSGIRAILSYRQGTIEDRLADKSF